MSRRLENLIVVVVGTGNHGQPACDAALPQAAVLPRVVAPGRPGGRTRLPSGVNAGTRPSGGSTTSDVWRVETTFVPRSHQKSLCERDVGIGASTVPAILILGLQKLLFRCSGFLLGHCVLSSSAAGRSNGVIVAIDQMPWRSGSPQGVLSAPSSRFALLGTSRRYRDRQTSMRCQNPPFLFEVAIHQLFNKLHALEFQELGVFLRAAIERHAHVPRARKNLRILDGDVILQHVAADRRIALDDPAPRCESCRRGRTRSDH